LARLVGVDLPKNKHLDRALTYIYGIGLTSARKILTKADLPFTMNSDDLDGEDVNKLRKIIEEEYVVEGDKRREVSLDIKRLTDLGCYRGRRHRAGLPTRGQRTKTNARTRKGPRRAISKKK
jgi:small subunit ribosomal protein S13